MVVDRHVTGEPECSLEGDVFVLVCGGPVMRFGASLVPPISESRKLLDLLLSTRTESENCRRDGVSWVTDEAKNSPQDTGRIVVADGLGDERALSVVGLVSWRCCCGLLCPFKPDGSSDMLCSFVFAVSLFALLRGYVPLLDSVKRQSAFPV